MDWKKLGKALLFPPTAIMLILIPIATVFLIYALVFMGHDSIPAILSYVLSFYTLMVWCNQLPRLIPMFRKFREENKYARRFLEDRELRMKVSLYGTLYFNTAYALLQLGLGFWHHTFWYYTLAGYYICLAIMRFFLACYIIRRKPGENQKEELLRYRNCGIVLLLMNLTLSVMVFFMIYWGRAFHHHEITTIALAAYTFGSLTIAIINVVKYRKYNSPVYSASKAISLAAACVSMLTLESTMLTTFGDGTMDLTTRKIMLGVSGGAISVFIIFMAMHMIAQGTKKIKLLDAAKEQQNG